MTEAFPQFDHPRYSLDHLVATGGMGEVWAATDTLLERTVAVKVLKPEYADDPVFRARFEGEARHAGALQHPNVAAVLDYGEVSWRDGSVRPFLVMELVDGRPLSAVLAQAEAEGSRLTPETAARLVEQAAAGVEAAHRLGIVHRDVKPGNLLVGQDGTVKVTDFGIARAADTVPLTRAGQLVGTPHYLSPEQVEGFPATPASDVYALGIVLFECLTGHKPFVADSPVATAMKHVAEPLPPLPDDVPAALQHVVLTATAKDPCSRFPSAGAMAQALASPVDDGHDLAAADLGAPEREAPDRVGPTGLAALFAEPPGASAAPGPHPAVRRGRRPPLVLAAALAVLLLGVVLWAAVLRDRATPKAAAEGDNQDQRVQVVSADYVGLPVTVAVDRLQSLGLHAVVRRVSNPDAHTPATVAGVSPTGAVKVGFTVTVSAWGPASIPTQRPSTAPPTRGGPRQAGQRPGSGQGPGPGTRQGSAGGAGGAGGAGSGRRPAHGGHGHDQHNGHKGRHEHKADHGHKDDHLNKQGGKDKHRHKDKG